MKKIQQILLGGFLLLCTVFIVITIIISGSQTTPDNSDCGTTDFGVSEDLPANQEQSAKEIFDYLVKKEGFSGKGSAGAVSVAERESSFNHLAMNSGGGVAGWFQWSGWSNSINGNRITSEGSIRAGDISTLTKANQFKLLSYELNGGYKHVKNLVGRATDSGQGALDWSEKYEGVNLSDPQTKVEMIKAGAVKWEMKFNATNIPSEITDTASDGANDSQIKFDPCKGGDGIPVGKGSGEQLDLGDGFGYGTYYENLPPHIKKAIGKRANYTSYDRSPADAPYGTQCVWYSRHRALEFGQVFSAGAGSGWDFGIHQAGFTVVVGKPYPHVVANLTRNDGGVGHSFFVEYVNPDGSLIISETNVVAGQSGFSRETANQTIETYRSVTPEEAKTYRYLIPNNTK